MYLIMVTETNVDGCGGRASEFVQFDVAPTEASLNELKACLEWAKNKADTEGCEETWDMVEAAVERLNEIHPGLNARMSDSGIPEVEF